MLNSLIIWGLPSDFGHHSSMILVAGTLSETGTTGSPASR